MNKHKIKNDLIYFPLALIVLLGGWVIYYKLPMPVIFEAIFCLWGISKINLYNNQNLKRLILFGLILLRVWLYRDFDSEFSTLIYSIFSPLSILITMLLPFNEVENIFIRFKKVLSVILIIGSIFHLLQFFNLLSFSPFAKVSLEVQDGTRIYYVYFLRVAEVVDGIKETWRFSSIFDEPGYLGTFIAFLLIIDKFDMKKKENVLFIISGILSLSFAFFIILVVYFLLSFVFSIRNFGNIKNVIGSFIIIIIIIFISSVLFPKSFVNVVLERFSYTQDYGFAGDSRGGWISSIEAFQYISKASTNELLFGHTKSYSDLYSLKIDTNPTWARLVYRFGLSTLIFLIIVLYSLAKKEKENLIFVTVFILSIYQRPEIFTLFFFFLLRIGMSKLAVNHER